MPLQNFADLNQACAFILMRPVSRHKAEKGTLRHRSRIFQCLEPHRNPIKGLRNNFHLECLKAYLLCEVEFAIAKEETLAA